MFFFVALFLCSLQVGKWPKKEVAEEFVGQQTSYHWLDESKRY
jgi:hypothetical protein